MSINNNEQFGDFITAPPLPEFTLPPTLDDLMKNNCNFERTFYSVCDDDCATVCDGV